MKKTIKFNNGVVTINFDSTRKIKVLGNPEDNTTSIVVPGLPTNLNTVKDTVTTHRPTLTKKERYFITASDHNGNSVFAMVQGKVKDAVLGEAKEITDEQFIELAQNFLDTMKGEKYHE